jgi:hypothetical protein
MAYACCHSHLLELVSLRVVGQDLLKLEAGYEDPRLDRSGRYAVRGSGQWRDAMPRSSIIRLTARQVLPAKPPKNKHRRANLRDTVITPSLDHFRNSINLPQLLLHCYYERIARI